MRPGSVLAGGRGIGHRPELAAELLRSRDAVDFVEVVAETCFLHGRTRREAVALSQMWPVVPHGVKLSLGSAEGIDRDKASRLGELARELDAPLVTEHVALTSAAGRDIGHLTPVPRCAEVVRALARNVDAARARLPDVPLLLENIAVPFALPGDAMSEPDFYGEIVERTGCDLLLDVANLYANAINAGTDAIAIARAYPLERVGMVHLAGGLLEDDFYFDTHAHDVPDAVFEVLACVFEARPDVPVVLERDANFEAGLGPLVGELERASALRTGGARRGEARSTAATRLTSNEGLDDGALEREQAELARLLTDAEAPNGSLAIAIGADGIERARGILQRKRVDDAMPLLPRLSRRSDHVRCLAERVVASAPRGPRMQAVLDAAAIAEAALQHRELSDDAVRDRLTMHARFKIPGVDAILRGAVPSARRGPFVARGKTQSGSLLWAIKGFGSLARVFLRERREAEPRDARRAPIEGETRS